ncbi:MAG TPA: GNAT family N-acetyltransferase [Bacteroidales bacterium]|nr:GNAT family N-acetyltransferase [Bacteroidales bacterium]
MLKSKNITLRAPEPSDIDLLYNWENDTDVWRISNTIAPYSKFTIENYIINNSQDVFTTQQVRFMIDTNNHPIATIGTIDLFDFDPLNKRAGIGILIIKQYREKGYAFETLNIIENYAKNFLNLHQLYCNILENNIASIKLFEKIGYLKTGVKKDWLLHDDKWIAELFFQKIL